MSKTILITGITGFVAHHIAIKARDLGYKVVGTVSNSDKVKEALLYADEISIFNLTDKNLPTFKSSIDFAVHCVIDVENPEHSIRSTIDLNELLLKNFLAKSIFISSMSMSETNRSNYSLIKQELENYFSRIGNSLILRPGLILGDGGLYLKMNNFVNNGRLIPLPDGGKYKMAVISIDQFVLYLFNALARDKSGIKNLFNQNLISLAQIVIDIARKSNKRIFVLYVPIVIVEFFSPLVISILNLMNVKISFDSIIGYKLYKAFKFPNSDLDLN